MKKEEPDRAARLAEALRANLRRRKAQVREQAVGDVPSSPGQEHSPTESPVAGQA